MKTSKRWRCATQAIARSRRIIGTDDAIAAVAVQPSDCAHRALVSKAAVRLMRRQEPFGGRRVNQPEVHAGRFLGPMTKVHRIDDDCRSASNDLRGVCRQSPLKRRVKRAAYDSPNIAA